MKLIAIALKKRTGRIRYKMDRLRETLVGSLPPRRIVFLHIPKCAGSSVNALFKYAIGPSRNGSTILIDDRLIGVDYNRKIEMARSAPFVGGHFGFETLQLIRGDELTFTVMRDPFERIRSTFGHFHTRKDGNPLGHKVPYMSIEDYLLSDDPEILQWTDNVVARQLCARHDRTSVAGIGTQEIISRAIANLETIDKVIFLDKLAAEMTGIMREAKIHYDGKMPRENVTARRAAHQSTAAIAPLSDRLMEIALPRVAADLAVYQHALKLTVAHVTFSATSSAASDPVVRRSALLPMT